MENKKPLLVAKDISISFGALKAVDNFNLEINSGELIGLIGPNGAGKTTVFNILTGVYNASSGEYTLDGENVIKTSTSALVKKGLARTFQNIRLFKYLTVLDNVVVAYNFRMKYGILTGMLRLPSYWREEKEAKDHLRGALPPLKIPPGGALWPRPPKPPRPDSLVVGVSLLRAKRCAPLLENAAPYWDFPESHNCPASCFACFGRELSGILGV